MVVYNMVLEDMVDSMVLDKKQELIIHLLDHPKEMVLRILVDSHDGDRVRINIPMMLIQVGLEMGMEMPQVSGNNALKNIDLAQIVELVQQGAIGYLVEVESSDGDVVRIFVE